jgi:cell division protein FtsB
MSDEYKAAWLISHSFNTGKTTKQIRRIIETFFESGKAKLNIEVTTPEIMKLQSELQSLRAENEKLKAENERLSQYRLDEINLREQYRVERDTLRTELTASRARELGLREALKKIAVVDNDHDHIRPYWEELASYRRKVAEKALSSTPTPDVGVLIEALEFIDGGCLVPTDGGDPRHPEDCVKAARDALAKWRGGEK